MKTSSRRMRAGVSLRYVFQTCTAISWGEERGDNEGCVWAFDGVAVLGATGGAACRTGAGFEAATGGGIGGFFAAIGC